MCYRKEAVENSERERRHGKEIHVGDGFTMVSQESSPSLCRLESPRRFPHPAKHRSFGNVEAEHLQFSMNPGGAPNAILGNHARNEIAQFPTDAFPSRTGPAPRKPRPVQLKTGPVPTNHSLWLDEDQSSLPSRPHSPQKNPEQSVRRPKPQLGMLPLKDCELLTKCQVFQEEISA
jgi:hypothetical protein